MSDSPIIFFGVGWMKAYKGMKNDVIKHGGAFVEKNGFGHECYNFLKSDERYYGYVEHNNAEIHIEKIGADKNAGAIDGVTVVWFAKNPSRGGLWIVGWYKNATVYRAKEGMPVPDEVMALRDKKEVNTYCVTAEEGVLLDEEERRFPISGIRRARIWYGGDDTTRDTIKKYIQDYEERCRTRIDKVEAQTESLQGLEREALIKQRVNQDRFRQELLDRYEGCCLCGVRNQKLLIASHIKPWSKSDQYEKLDADNGLLLCPNHDKLFDAGLISFNDDGEIILSDKMSPDDRILMNVRDGDYIDVSEGMAAYLRYHRENVFLGA